MKPFPYKRTIFSASNAVALMLSAGVHAQEGIPKQVGKVDDQSVQTDQSKGTPQKVEVKAKSETENARSDAAAKTVISNVELNRFGDNNITEAMKRVPGIIVIDGAIQFPGMGAKYTQILVDGEAPRGIDIKDIPMSAIDRIEISRLGSAEFSAQGGAGTINIILKKVPRKGQQQIKLGVESEFKPETNAEWMISDKQGNLGYSFIVAAVNGHNTFAAPYHIDTTIIDKNNQPTQSYSLVETSTRLNQSLRLMSTLQYKTNQGLNIRSNTSFTATNTDAVVNSDYHFFTGAELPVAHTLSLLHSQVRSGNSTLKLLDTIAQDIKLDASVTISGVEMNDSSHRFYSKTNTSPIFDRLTTSHQFQNGVGSSFKLSVPTNEKHDLVVGGNGYTKHANNARFQTDHFPTGDVAVTDMSNQTIISNWALFAQDEWRFQKSSSAYFGLRWETVRIQSEGAQQFPVRNVSNVWSPIVQTLWQLNPDNTDRLRLGISRTFQAPQNFYLVAPKFNDVNNTISNPNFRGNPHLRPELAWSMESSYEHNGKDELNFNLRAIIRSIQNAHRKTISFEDNAWWSQWVNAGDAISKRIDVDTSFPLKRFVDNAPDLSLSFFVSRNWTTMSTLPKPDNLLTPIKLMISTSLDYEAKDLPLTMGASLRYRDSQPMLINELQRTIGHARTDLDIYGLWKFSPKTHLRFAVNNVLKGHDNSSNIFYDTAATSMQDQIKPGYRMVQLKLEHGF